MFEDLKFELGLAGEMGKKSICCIHMLRTNDVVSWVLHASSRGTIHLSYGAFVKWHSFRIKEILISTYIGSQF
jgi:hypothetical protein